jgi:hypothetical protein
MRPILWSTLNNSSSRAFLKTCSFRTFLKNYCTSKPPLICHVIFKYFMTLQRCFTMRLKPTSAHENTWIYYITIIVNLLHVSVTLHGLLQGSVFTRDILGDWNVYEVYDNVTNTHIFICTCWFYSPNVLSCFLFPLATLPTGPNHLSTWLTSIPKMESSGSS